MRRLVTIRRVNELKPIEGADRIELAIVDGWQVVVRKNEFKVNDLAVYFEIDSFLPNVEQFQFLAPRSTKTMNGELGFRLKTIKLKGEISQGLLLPISSFKLKNVSEGDDVTAELNVKLYEVTRNNFTMVKPKGAKALFYRVRNRVLKVFPKLARIFDMIDKFVFKTKFIKKIPHFINKTDQERIQNLANKLDYLSGFSYEVSIKLDGSSMTVFKNNDEVGVCSRNLDVTDQDNIYTKVEKKYGIIEALKVYNPNIAIQGELIGEGIQKNPEKIEGLDYYVFDVYDIDKKRYLLPDERISVLEDLSVLGCKLKHVPIIHKSYKVNGMSVNDLLKMAEGESLFAKEREGLVFKSNSLNKNRIASFKAISNSYLLKTGG